MKENKNQYWEQWINDGGFVQGDSHELTKIIYPNTGVECSAEQFNKEYIAYKGSSDNTIRLEITSWVGTSNEAIHYYGNLKDLCRVFWKKSEHDDYSTAIYKEPKSTQEIKIHLTRPLTTNELVNSNNEYDRW